MVAPHHDEHCSAETKQADQEARSGRATSDSTVTASFGAFQKSQVFVYFKKKEIAGFLKRRCAQKD